MSKEPIEYLKHIRDECSFILSVIPEDFSKNEFLSDETLKRAIVRSLEIIGEATKRINKDFRNKYPRIPWQDMAGMRDILIHDYLNLDIGIIWNTIKEGIPNLKIPLNGI